MRSTSYCVGTEFRDFKASDSLPNDPIVSLNLAIALGVVVISLTGSDASLVLEFINSSDMNEDP